MRKRIFCAAALLCGASLANAQGFGSQTATGQPLGTYFSNQGYYISAPGYSAPGYSAAGPATAGVSGAMMPGYAAGAMMPGYAAGAMGYPVLPANYGYTGYGYGYGLPAQPSVPMTLPPMMGPEISGMPVAPEEAVIDGGGADILGPNKHRFWINAGYTLTWVQPQSLSFPLVTIGAAADGNRAGALDQPNTSVIFGGNINHNEQNGFRIDAGLFLDQGRVYSLEVGGSFFEQTGVNFAKESDLGGVPVIARPIFDTSTNAPGRLLDSFPGGLAGGVRVDSQLSLFMAEANAAYNVCGEGWSAAALLGVRYMRLGETLTINDRVSPLVDDFIVFNGGGVLVGDVVTDTDRFRTTNNFYGGQIGGRVRLDGSWVFFAAHGKIGLGVTEQTVDISGSTTLIQANGQSTTLTGGALALPSNIGTRTRTVFSYTPEAGITVGLKLTQHLALSAGYTFTYWSHVVRPGRQIDGFVNSTQIPTADLYGQTQGTTRPLFNFNDESIYLHTLQLGLNLNY
ncbi:MAG: BBP7 family outer membrane beta-barrel protein [Gemmataceae bacterium]